MFRYWFLYYKMIFYTLPHLYRLRIKYKNNIELRNSINNLINEINFQLKINE